MKRFLTTVFEYFKHIVMFTHVRDLVTTPILEKCGSHSRVTKVNGPYPLIQNICKLQRL